MSRYMSQRRAALEPYVPGEQPKQGVMLKLNTNESPFPPSAGVVKAVTEQASMLQLYSDPACTALQEKLAAFYGVRPEQVLMTNGSDDILSYAFTAFGDESHPFAFPAVTYGFYTVFAALNQVPFRQIPLREDLTIDPADYEGIGMNIVIANPNAPTGLTLSRDTLERIVASNPNNVVIVDEAYVDFGGESCIPLIDRYDNLLVTRTFSKSYSLAGARLGCGIGNAALIADLATIKFSTNPYSVNRMTLAAGVAALEDADYYRANCETIIENRAYTTRRLRELGFRVADSSANFVFAAHPMLDGGALQQALKARGILVRHFAQPGIDQYNRITIGTRVQMDTLLQAIEEIKKEMLA